MANTDAERVYELVRDIRTRLSRIHHDINNPLSIVSGNVQLLRELSLVLEVGNDFSEPLNDVEEAMAQLTDCIDEIMVIRNLLADLPEKD